MARRKRKRDTEPAAAGPAAGTANPNPGQYPRLADSEIASLVPCSPPPLYFLTGARNVWAISDAPPRQNFWTPADPADIGLATPADGYGVYAYQTSEQPLPRSPVNVAARVGELLTGTRQMDVHVCVSRASGVLTGRRQDAVRAVREMKRRYHGTGVAVLERCHYSDPLTSWDLQAIARTAIGNPPVSGAVVVCDMEYDTGWWDEQLIKQVAGTPWVSALFYTQNPAPKAPGWAVTWDTAQDGICPGVDLAPGSRLVEFPDPREPPAAGREPWRLALRGRPGIVGVGVVNPSLPERIVEVLRLITVLRAADIPTDAATLSDYLEKRSNPDALVRTERTLLSAAALLGANLDSAPRIYQDQRGQWVHTLPVDLDTPGGETELEAYRWYAMLSGCVQNMLERRP